MRWNLPSGQMPEAWFNVVPHLPEPLQPDLHPGTREPIGPEDLAPLFPMALIAQEVTSEPWVDIPGEVLDVLRLWRPTPLIRAQRLEKALGTPARIYYKDESVSPAGSHKPNTAVPQAFYNKQAGIARLATETGAGQWGSALAYACALFGLECKVYMVRASYNQKPYRRIMMETWGGSVVPSPVDDPDSPGSLGSAISDAVRDAVSREGHALLARLGAQPRPLAPDRHRARGQGTAGPRRGAPPRHRDRLVRRRVEPRRYLASLRSRARSRPTGRRAVLVPDADEGDLRVRLRRRRQDDASPADVHTRPRVHPAVDPRRGPPLPRRRADHLQSGEKRQDAEQSPIPRARSSKRPCSSPGPRGRSRRRRRRMPSGP